MTYKGTNDVSSLGYIVGADGIDTLCNFAVLGSFGRGKLVVGLMKSGRSTIVGQV